MYQQKFIFGLEGGYTCNKDYTINIDHIFKSKRCFDKINKEILKLKPINPDLYEKLCISITDRCLGAINWIIESDCTPSETYPHKQYLGFLFENKLNSGHLMSPETALTIHLSHLFRQYTANRDHLQMGYMKYYPKGKPKYNLATLIAHCTFNKSLPTKEQQEQYRDNSKKMLKRKIFKINFI